MTVNPGFGGQAFIAQSLLKIGRLRRLIASSGGSRPEIEVDGGIDASTAPAVVAAGATVLVAGSAVFSAGSIKDNIQALRRSLAVEV